MVIKEYLGLTLCLNSESVETFPCINVRLLSGQVSHCICEKKHKSKNDILQKKENDHLVSVTKVIIYYGLTLSTKY